MVTAGGDGSLVGILMAAKENGVRIENILVCPLPYGTGNDLSRTLHWGGQPSIYPFTSMRSLMKEICLHTKI